jgi:pimeloyl-ACP methyl ester carboxylesterase
MVLKSKKSFDGLRIYYEIRRKKGPFLVFLHGWPLNHTFWNKELDFFHRHGYSTLALDLRGNGKSEKPNRLSDYSIDKMAKDVSFIAQKEEIDHFHLIGHSFGGMVCLEHYSEFPEQVDSLVLLDTTYESPLKEIPFLRYFRLTPLTVHLLKFILEHEHIQKKHFPFLDFSAMKDHSDFYYWLRGVEDTPFKSVLAALEDMLELEMETILPSISIPTLIIEGERDNKTPLPYAKKMASLIPGAELIILKNATHDTNIQHPKTVEKEIIRFLKR